MCVYKTSVEISMNSEYFIQEYRLLNISSPAVGNLDVLPVVRDYDAHMFCLTRNQQFVVGGFDRQAKPAFSDGIPHNWRELLEGDNEQFSKYRNCIDS